MFRIEARSKGRVSVDTSRDMFLRHQHFTEKSWARHKGDFGTLGCTFEACDFSEMRVPTMEFASGIELTRYIACKFDRSRFKRVVAGQARFERCSFLNVDITDLFSHAAEFVDCTFSGVLRNSVFFGRVFGNHALYTSRKTNEFRGNDFSAMKFVGVDFRQGVDLALQRLPVGDDYLYLADAEEKLSALRRTYLQQPPSPRRQAVFEFLRFPEEEVRDGQLSLFLSKEFWPSLNRETIDAIFEELRSM